ncbi:hypothetical protein CLV33_11640 [Jejuia pallidilutea]|uniref:Membrane or secreted protein n=1 Tax=Jejuia pallidilutea TaxID=504487 RepID=A0A362WX02_9FLAO|nr:membrane or secreted protein [Jejuia pallidilutea]PQV44922.1 hypothetical protein CLV33_11640 [Jejuia pallidilutea]
MKKLIILLAFLSFSFIPQAQNIIGAWETTSISKDGDQIKSVLIFAKDYQVLSTYNALTGKFIQTNGGKWELEGDTMIKLIEFHTENAELVGTKISYKVRITTDELEIIERGLKFKRIDDGTPGKLQGAWLMSGRIRDGVTQSRDTNRPRKTMKILSGTRFQWIAYNTETKQFMGTGGGTYTTKNGNYTENIEFFSRDDAKVGLSLKFNYELIDGKWHHSGLSSKGDPIHEIWSIRE